MKKIFDSILIAITLISSQATALPVMAQKVDTFNTDSKPAWSWTNISILPPCLRTADQAQNAGIKCVEDSIKYYINLLLLVIGVASFVYMLYAALLYTTAFGDENKIKQAKKTITYALIGIVLATLAWTIVAVLSSILGVDAPS